MRILIVSQNQDFAYAVSKDLLAYFGGGLSNNDIDVFFDYYKIMKFSGHFDYAFLDFDLISDIDKKTLNEFLAYGIFDKLISIISEEPFEEFELEINPLFILHKNSYNDDLKSLFVMMNRMFDMHILMKVTQLSGTKKIVNQNSIIFIESNRGIIYLHTHDGVVSLKGLMKNLITELDNKLFVQVAKSYIINCDYITDKTANTVTLVGNYQFSIGRKYKTSFAETYNRFFYDE